MNNLRGVHIAHMDSSWNILRGIKSLTPTSKKDMLLYLIVASKTWTVESLSNETVLITNLTAFWNSDEFPIIFKQRNTHHSLQAAWNDTKAADQPPHLRLHCLWLCHSGEGTQKGGGSDFSHACQIRDRQRDYLLPLTQESCLQVAQRCAWTQNRTVVAMSFRFLLPQAELDLYLKGRIVSKQLWSRRR